MTLLILKLKRGHKAPASPLGQPSPPRRLVEFAIDLAARGNRAVAGRAEGRAIGARAATVLARLAISALAALLAFHVINHLARRTAALTHGPATGAATALAVLLVTRLAATLQLFSFMRDRIVRQAVLRVVLDVGFGVVSAARVFTHAFHVHDLSGWPFAYC